VCLGRGKLAELEGSTAKVRNFFPFVFALLFSAAAMFLLGRLAGTSDDKITSSLTTLLGTIVGFYFGGRHRT
jgi:hypothetical protein